MLGLLFILYLIAINAATYWLYWYDCRGQLAKTARVPENMLLWFGFFGGTAAALLAQRRFKHKLKKSTFQHRFWMLTVVQACMVVFLPAPILYAM